MLHFLCSRLFLLAEYLAVVLVVTAVDKAYLTLLIKPTLRTMPRVVVAQSQFVVSQSWFTWPLCNSLGIHVLRRLLNYVD